MDNRIWKYPLVVLLALMVVATLLLAAYGMFSILSAIVLYGLLLTVGLVLIGRLVRNEERRKSFIVMLVSIVISLFVSELVMRYVVKQHLSYTERLGGFFYTSPYPRWELQNFLNRHFTDRGLYERLVKWPNRKVDYQTPEFAYEYYYNELGLKGPQPDCVEGNRVVVGLGASFTEGIGTTEDSCWLALLAKQLSDSTVYVNGGISGRDLFDGLVILERVMQQCQPELVVLALNATTISDVIMNGGYERYSGGADLKGRSAPWFDPLYGSSFIFRTFAHKVFGLNYFLMTDTQWNTERKKALTLIEECIRERYQPLAKKHGFRFVVVLHPLYSELNSGVNELEGLANNLIEDKNQVTLDLHSQMRHDMQLGVLDADSLFWPLDGHHNSKGNLYWSSQLEQVLTEIRYAEN